MRNFACNTLWGIVSILWLLAVSCTGRQAVGSHGASGDTIPFRHATLLTAVRYPSHVHVEIINPWRKGEVLHSYDIRQPFRRAVITTTSHSQLLVSLGQTAVIKGVCDARYMRIDAVQRGLQQGTITDCGNAMQPLQERIIALHADAVLVSPFENNGGYGSLEALGIPLIEAADYMEPTPLARAEWMRFYGLLFGCEHEADSLFLLVEQRYRALADSAAVCVSRPTVFSERQTGNVWYVPGGESCMARLMADAAGQYVWHDDAHSGSLPLSFEEVLTKARKADFWLLTNSTHVPLTASLLVAEQPGYAQFEAFRKKQVFVCETNATRYFETIPFRPDLLLHDIIQVLHPGLLQGTPQFYHRLP